MPDSQVARSAVSLKSHGTILKKVAHTRLPSVGFRSLFRFLAVSLQVTLVINPAVYMLPLLSIRPAVTLATLKRAATNFAAGEQRHNGCEQFA